MVPMTRIHVSTIAMLATLCGACAPTPLDAVSMDRNDVYVGQELLTDAQSAVIAPAATAHNTIVVAGAAVDVGLFDDACIAQVDGRKPEWATTSASCALPNGDVFTAARARIYLARGVYAVAVEGAYTSGGNTVTAVYSAQMGEDQYL